MYAVSDQFHQAVRNGNKQKVMLIFPDAVFTDEDINVETGIEFHDYFNLEDDISIGQTPSNEISFSLFNDYKFLNNYGFGDFLATIGVYLDETEYEMRGNTTMRTVYASYAGKNDPPYLTRNERAVDAPPGFPVASLMGYDGKVWAFSSDGQYAVYNDHTGENITSSNPVNAFMRDKSKDWVGRGLFYNKSSRMLMTYDADGMRRRYEFCPLGWFVGERPNAPDKIEIGMTCYDLMQRFDIDMPDTKTLGISYPVKIGTLFQKMCDYVGLPYRTASFINSNATVDSEPEDFGNSTMRTVLGWIAEAAGSNARIDRDGYVVMDWIRNTAQSYDESGYYEFEPYWYQTKRVTKLYCRDTTDSKESTVGSGSEGYLIQDNPLLR